MKPYTETPTLPATLITEYDPPIVLIHSSHISDSFTACQKAMNELYLYYKVQASGLCVAMPEVETETAHAICHPLECDMVIGIDGCRIKIHSDKICTENSAKIWHT